MSKLWVPHRYQQSTVQFLHDRTAFSPTGKGGAGVFLDPGMGKTACILEFMKQLKELGMANRFLVVAPLRVCYSVWPQEIQEWSNFSNISYTVVHGTAAVKRKKLSLPVNLHIINRDNMVWLADQLAGRENLPWQGIIIDESTSFKSWSSKRSKALRKIIKRIPYRIIMTGTPSPKNLTDLFPQMWLLDEGETLGKDVTEFRNRYCIQEGTREQNKWAVRHDWEDEVKRLIQPMCLRLDIRDYLSMPEKIEHTVHVELPPAAKAQYDDMERQMFMLLESGDPKEAVNAGAKYNLCRQISNGGVYDHERKAVHLHDAKTEACLDIIDELGGKPVLIAYHFEHDVQRLQRVIPKLHIIRGGMQDKKVQHLIDAWNNDTLDPPILAVQPQALSYGINMQKGSGRDIIWYGPTDNLDTYIQFNARIWRQGIGSTVRIHRISSSNTIDDMVYARTDEKQDVQASLLENLRRYAREKHV